MEDIVYEIIGGAVILAILITVISIFRTSGNLIKDTAERQSELDSSSIVSTIGFDGGVYGGSKIQDAIEYSKMVQGISVIIDGKNINAMSEAEINGYITNTANRYVLNVSYVDASGVKIESNALGIASIEFQFTKK